MTKRLTRNNALTKFGHLIAALLATALLDLPAIQQSIFHPPELHIFACVEVSLSQTSTLIAAFSNDDDKLYDEAK